MVLVLARPSWEWSIKATMKPISELPETWQEWYREWETSVPENENKRRLRGELLGEPRGEPSYSAAFELFLFSSFKKIGLSVTFQPEINGVNADFHISDMRGCGAYVEAGVMFSNPLETESSYMSMGMRIWEEFKKLQSHDFFVQRTSSSGHPGNVSPKLVRREVQQWIDQLDTAEIRKRPYYDVLPYKTFRFKNWMLKVKLQLKSLHDKERLGAAAVGLAGFSGSWSDHPASRLRSKLKKKASQVRKTRENCLVAITERQPGLTVDDVQAALFGGTSDCDLGSKANDSHPYVNNLFIPRPGSDGLWSRNDAKQPMAAIIHKGDLESLDPGETALWLNPNSSYFDVPLPLFSLTICALQRKLWTRLGNMM